MVRTEEPGQPAPASARIRATAAQLGFTTPPVPLRLKLQRTPACWSLFLQPQLPSPLGPIVAWLEPWSPLRLEFGSRGMMRADFDPLPDGWRSRLDGLDLEMLLLDADGTAHATVSGPHAALAALGRALSTGAHVEVAAVRERPSDAPLLTRAQDEALRAAVAAGYYRIPRPLNLHELAARLGVSPAALSERLRRAEGRVILRYATEGATTPWDARTIFGAPPPKAR